MIYVKDLPAMLAFYHQILGLPLIPASRTDTWAEFEAGNATLALHAIPPEIAAQFEITSPPQPREDSPTKLIFTVPDLPAECARLESLGVPLTRLPWNAADALDPEGNIFQLRAR